MSFFNYPDYVSTLWNLLHHNSNCTANKQTSFTEPSLLTTLSWIWPVYLYIKNHTWAQYLFPVSLKTNWSSIYGQDILLLTNSETDDVGRVSLNDWVLALDNFTSMPLIKKMFTQQCFSIGFLYRVKNDFFDMCT